MMPLRSLLVLWIACLYASPLSAQYIVRGLVTDKADQPVDACVVFLLHPSSLLLEDHTLTQADGQYQLTAKTPGDYILEFRNLAYWDTSIHISLESPSPLAVNAILTAKIFDLQAVEVIDKLLGIRRSGDTLIYNPHAYTDGSEAKISDMLRKLPGIDVSPAGQVSYMGKTIDALLVDGHDLTGNRHSDITEHFPSDGVDRIQVIEHYVGEFDARSLGGPADRVAMNIQLTRDKQGVTTGHVTAGLGTDDRYTGRLNALRATRRTGISLFSGSSNQERQPPILETVGAYENYQKHPLGSRRFPLIPYPILTTAQPANRFADHFIRVTESNRLNPVWSRRTEAELAGGRYESQLQSIKERFADRSLEESTQQMRQRQLTGRLMHDTRLQLAPAWRLLVNAGIQALHPDTDTRDAGSVDGLPFMLHADGDRRLTRWQVSGLAEWSLHPDHLIRLSADYQALKVRSTSSMQSSDPLFGFSFPDASGQNHLRYQDEYRQYLGTVGAAWAWSTPFADLSVFGKHLLLREQLQFSYQDTAAAGRNSLRMPIAETGVKVKIPVNRLTLTGDIHLLRQGANELTTNASNHILPGLRIQHPIGRLNVLSLHIGRQLSLPGLMYAHGLPLLLDHRTQIPYALLADDRLTSWKGTISFTRKPGDYKQVWIATLSATRQDKSLITREEQVDQHIVRTVRLLPASRQYQLTAFGWHTARTWKLTLHQTAMHHTGFSMVENMPVHLNYVWIRTMLGFSYKGFRGYELSASPEIQYQRQQLPGLTTYWTNPAIRVGIRHKGLSWEYGVDFTQHMSRTQSGNIDLQILNVSLGYRKWMPFRIYLEGVNLLNLGANQSLTATLNPAFSHTLIADRLPGSILLVGRYDF